MKWIRLNALQLFFPAVLPGRNLSFQTQTMAITAAAVPQAWGPRSCSPDNLDDTCRMQRMHPALAIVGCKVGYWVRLMIQLMMLLYVTMIYSIHICSILFNQDPDRSAWLRVETAFCWHLRQDDVERSYELRTQHCAFLGIILEGGCQDRKLLGLVHWISCWSAVKYVKSSKPLNAINSYIDNIKFGIHSSNHSNASFKSSCAP